MVAGKHRTGGEAAAAQGRGPHQHLHGPEEWLGHQQACILTGVCQLLLQGGMSLAQKGAAVLSEMAQQLRRGSSPGLPTAPPSAKPPALHAFVPGHSRRALFHPADPPVAVLLFDSGGSGHASSLAWIKSFQHNLNAASVTELDHENDQPHLVSCPGDLRTKSLELLED